MQNDVRRPQVQPPPDFQNSFPPMSQFPPMRAAAEQPEEPRDLYDQQLQLYDHLADDETLEDEAPLLPPREALDDIPPAQVERQAVTPTGDEFPPTPGDPRSFQPIDPCSALNPIENTITPENCKLRSHLAKFVTAWVTKHQKTWNLKTRELFPSFVERVRAAIAAVPEEDRPSLSTLAHEWGLPAEIAGPMHVESLLRVISAAVILSS